MSKLDRVLRVAVLLGAVGFAAAMLDLLLGRLGRGDVYPPYSSYRADPMGTKALYDSLASLPGLSVERNLDALERFSGGQGQMMILAGEAGNRFDRWQDAAAVERLERFVNAGGRLVIALVHHRDAWSDFDWDHRPTSRPARSKSRPASDKSTTAPAEPKDDEPSDVELGPRWGFAVGVATAPQAELRGRKDTRHGVASREARRIAALGTEESVSWLGGLHLEPKDPLWKVIYRTDAGAAIIERPMGRGWLVLCSDSFFLSNEGLRHRRNPRLLAWLIGASARSVIFDETHLGIQSDLTVMALMRRHNLQTALAALAVVAGLYLWRSLSHLGPVTRPEGAIDTGAVAGRDSISALVSLLRRAIGRRDLLTMCVREWSRPTKAASTVSAGEASDARAAQLRAAAAAAGADDRTLVNAYKTMCRILAERK
ncbi:MAG: DUF4350 domain-containing protein [Planctomycetaceae bacterium]|nr:DUF4350 domain-containing protein [Planctomycetaceae bacterium]